MESASGSPSSSSHPLQTFETSEKPHQSPVTKELSGRQYGIEGLDEDVQDADATDSNKFDQRDMQRLGKTQEMKRNFRSLSMLSFVVIVQSTWEFVLVLALFHSVATASRVLT